MLGVEAQGIPSFDVKVITTDYRGPTPEELAKRALDKLLSVSDTADPMVKAQAMVYKERIRALLEFYMNEAITSYKVTLCADLTKQGHADMAQIISKI